MKGRRLPIPQGLRSFFSKGWNQLLFFLVLASIDTLYDLTGWSEPDFSSPWTISNQLFARFVLFLGLGIVIGFTIYYIETGDEGEKD